MADHPTKLREVAWTELFPWLILVRSVRIALMARVMVLGAAGLIAVTLGWRLIGWVFSGSDDPVVAQWRVEASHWVWQNSAEFSIAMSARSADEIFRSAASGLLEAPVALWLHLTRPFVDLFRADLTSLGFLYLLLCGVWELLVWGVAGGAITRIAALKFTRDEAPGLLAAVKHAAGKVLSYSLPPLVALAGAAVFAIQLLVLGLLMRLELIAMLAGLVWPFVLLLGLLMAILLIGALVGWPLMWATISVEGTDAFDALSRSYAYTYHRPWRLIWYVLFVAVLAVASMFVVKAFAATAIALGDWSIDWGLDEATIREVVAPVDGEASAVEKPELGVLLSTARSTIHFWKSMMAALAAGYQAGFLWVSAVGVYLLLRRDIDGVPLSDVYIDQDEGYGLPPLAEDAATGVPEISPREPAQPGDTGSVT